MKIKIAAASLGCVLLLAGADAASGRGGGAYGAPDKLSCKTHTVYCAPKR